MNEHNVRKEYDIIQDTKKFQCPAQVRLKEVIQFTDHQVTIYIDLSQLSVYRVFLFLFQLQSGRLILIVCIKLFNCRVSLNGKRELQQR